MPVEVQREILALVSKVWTNGNAEPEHAAKWLLETTASMASMDKDNPQTPQEGQFDIQPTDLVEAMLCVALSNHPNRTLLVAYKEEAIYQDANLLLRLNNPETRESIEIRLSRDSRKLFLPMGSSFYSIDIAALCQGWHQAESKLKTLIETPKVTLA